MELTNIIIWIIVGALAIFIEAISVQLISIWFVFGAIVALILALCDVSVKVQIIVFLVVSFGLLAITYPFLRKFLLKKYVPLNADSVIGKAGIVTEDINNIENKGLVKVNGQTWSAVSQNDENIPKDEKVIIKEIKGVKVIVTPLSKDESEE